jgi:hypothetical protein
MRELNQIRKLENLHIGFWLLKDASWCQHWVAVGLLAAIPTLVISIRIAWYSRHSASEMVHNISVCLWIVANVIWMIGEFFFDDTTRNISKLFFFSRFITFGGRGIPRFM